VLPARRAAVARALTVAAGDGLSGEALARELGIADDVHLAGFRPNPFAFMARADLFALASRVEGAPLVIVEALACGLPVVATKCSAGCLELLENGRHGRLVPVGDPSELSAALIDGLNEPHDHESLKRRGREFAADAAADLYIKLLARSNLGAKVGPFAVRGQERHDKSSTCTYKSTS
jgi:glycosyltransferase involved in cell wall biosynthesis